MKKLLTVDTWLPIFSGFYGTIWEGDSDMERELENINEDRKAKGLPPLSDENEVEWDYEGYQKAVASGMTQFVGDLLVDKGLVKKYTNQKLVSPREYNFANDSINVSFTLSPDNCKKILSYLNEHKKEFAVYIAEHYTSYDGFCSSYSSNVNDWLTEEVLEGTHQLGSVLEFILRNEDGSGIEGDAYEDLNGNGVVISASNYSKLVEVA